MGWNGGRWGISDFGMWISDFLFTAKFRLGLRISNPRKFKIRIPKSEIGSGGEGGIRTHGGR